MPDQHETHAAPQRRCRFFFGARLLAPVLRGPCHPEGGSCSDAGGFAPAREPRFMQHFRARVKVWVAPFSDSLIERADALKQPPSLAFFPTFCRTYAVEAVWQAVALRPPASPLSDPRTPAIGAYIRSRRAADSSKTTARSARTSDRRFPPSRMFACRSAVTAKFLRGVLLLIVASGWDFPLVHRELDELKPGHSGGFFLFAAG